MLPILETVADSLLDREMHVNNFPRQYSYINIELQRKGFPHNNVKV